MRHRYKKISFKGGGRDKAKMIKRTLIRNFILRGSLDTTDKKARYIKQTIDRIVLRARRYLNADKKALNMFFGENDTINKLRSLDFIMKSKRESGFVRVIKKHFRINDASLIVNVSWVDNPQVDKLIKDKNEKKND